MAYHYLKTETEYYKSVEFAVKRFELRKNDRGFQVGDFIVLEETINGVRTGRQMQPKKIRYILHGGKFGLDEDYCILNW